MTPPPRLSVVIPAKDAEAHIAEALTSLTHQGVPGEELEVVLVDDGSSDLTGEVAAGFADRFGSFRLLRSERPTGVAAARNRGLRAARGEALTFLDADDWYGNGHLAVMLAALDALGTDSVRTDIILASGKHRSLKAAPVHLRGRRLRCADYTVRGFEQTMVDYPNPPTGVFRRHLLDSGLLLFDEDLRSAEDREWNWRLMLESETFAVVDTPGVYYRRDVAGSITAVYDETQLDFIAGCAKTLARTRALGCSNAHTLKAAHNLFALADLHLQRRAEMSRRLRAELIAGVAEVGAGLPEEDLAALLGSFTRKRQAALRPILREIERRRSSATRPRPTAPDTRRRSA